MISFFLILYLFAVIVTLRDSYIFHNEYHVFKKIYKVGEEKKKQKTTEHFR